MISIIVPIYNVEPYLRRCLDSLVALEPIIKEKTTKSLSEKNDIEIILIDDGSTDDSGRTADEYALHYSNFIVYHTENCGLSAARNYGIEKSHGEWLMFVDSDDWVKPNFCRIPYMMACDYNADLVIFNIYVINSKGESHKLNSIKFSRCASPEEAIEFGNNCAWNKLYKKELFEQIRYPEGHVYEDLATTHKLVYKAKLIVMIEDSLIYHSYRIDSITHTYNIANADDLISACIQRYRFLSEHDYPIEKYLPYCRDIAFSYCMRINPSDNSLYLQAEKIIDDIKHIPNSFSLKARCMLIIWKISKPLFHFICRVCGKKLSE